MMRPATATPSPLSQETNPLEERAARALSSGPDPLFDVHASGQLRLGAVGDQLELLPLADALIPASSGTPLTSPNLVRTTEGDPNQ